jgi:O-acetyl-ADP-ribose deacetylase (regulator of RNase III)
MREHSSNPHGYIELAPVPLERSGCEMIAYGINHTGQLVGSTAQAILVNAGTAARDAARECLATTDRGLGTVVVTPSFGLAPTGVKWIAHVVSTPKHTPKSPGWLVPAMNCIIDEALKREVPRVGVVALGTAGGIAPETAARILTDTVRARHREWKGEKFPKILFCLPDPRVFQAFSLVLKG